MRHETIQRRRPKVRRNAPCPCGSGRKYKRCCLPGLAAADGVTAVAARAGKTAFPPRTDGLEQVLAEQQPQRFRLDPADVGDPSRGCVHLFGG